jgi:hypothetical protein
MTYRRGARIAATVRPGVIGVSRMLPEEELKLLP